MLSPDSSNTPTRKSIGTASLSTSSLFVFSSGDKLASPVTLPPGLARVETRPTPTGSETLVITMGMVVVAFFAANAAGVLDASHLKTGLAQAVKLIESGNSCANYNRVEFLDRSGIRDRHGLCRARHIPSLICGPIRMVRCSSSPARAVHVELIREIDGKRQTRDIVSF